jgi:hypothetical protein
VSILAWRAKANWHDEVRRQVGKPPQYRTSFASMDDVDIPAVSLKRSSNPMA